MNQITFKQYRNIDLVIWTVLLVIFETITTFATTKWFAVQAVAISISLALICIVMMRWSGYAAILAVVGGFVYCLASGAEPKQYLIYCIGNLFSLVALLLFKLFDKEKIRTGVWKLVLFVLVAYIGMAIGRGAVTLFFGGDINAFVVFATTDIISLLFAEIILILLRKSEGMIEDQKTYLLRLDREKKEKENVYAEQKTEEFL